MSLDAFHEIVKAGIIVFVFDGFDEIAVDKRLAAERQILDWANRYSELTVVVSGREDDRFSAWRLFSTFYVLPFDKEKVIDMVHKLRYDEAIGALTQFGRPFQ